MKISVNSAVKYIFFFGILILNFVFLNNKIEPKLHYHVQQLSFVFSSEYLTQHLLLPGNFSEYLSDLLSQLFYFNFWGSLLITVIAALISVVAIHILNQFPYKKISFFLALMPLSFLFPLFTNYYFPFDTIVNIFVIYLFTALYIHTLKKEWNIFPVYSIIAFILYYLFGSEVFMIFSANAIVTTVFFRKIKISSIFSLYVLVIATILPYIAYKFIFNINLSTAYFSLLPEIPHVIKYNPDIFLYLLYFFLPFSLIVISILSALPYKSADIETQQETNISVVFLKKWSVLILSILLIGLTNYFGSKKKFDNHKKNIALADYYNYHEQWSEAKEIILSDYQYDIMLNYSYVRAIDHLGEFLNSYFSYRQLLGGDALFPDRIESTTTVMISSDYYYDLGYITQAHHWAHEAQTSLPNSPRILKRLVMTNLIMGNYVGSRNLLLLLDKIPYNKEFVEKYMKYTEDTSLIASDTEITEKRSLMPDKGAIVVDNFAQRMYDLLENRKNKSAYDHLQMYFLLTHRLGNFMKHLAEGPQYYKTIPLLFEEAIMLYSAKTRQRPVNLKISNAITDEIKGFNDIMMQYNGDKNAAKDQLRSLYGNTYMYYIVYNSPLVTKAELKVKK